MKIELKKRSKVPSLEALEDRTTPAQFGLAWADPTHLTASFVPDGTLAGDVASRLPAAWRGAVLRAIQTWSEAASVNVGLVADGGQAFGVSGETQGDGRFGDLRVGALPLGTDALGVATPPSPFLQGTLPGDVILNSGNKFTLNQLFSTALHEVGHALGLAPSTNPRSVMNNTFANNVALAAEDVASVRALYGTRVPDQNEGDKGNNLLRNASRLDYGSSDGSIPLVAFGDVTTRADLDHFVVRGLSGYTGPMTVRVETAGISLLQARVTVLGSAGQVLGQAVGASGGTLSVTLPRTAPGATYYVRVSAAPAATFAVGRYALAVTFNGRVTTPAARLAEVLHGPFDVLRPDKVSDLFRSPDGLIYDKDAGTDDTAAEAPRLASVAGAPADSLFRVTSSLDGASDVDFYRVRSPRSGTRRDDQVLTVHLRAAAVNGVVPDVALFDRDGKPVDAVVLIRTDDEVIVQATGLEQGRDYSLRMTGSTGGNYHLEARYLTKAAESQTFASGDVPASGGREYKLYVGRTQLFGLTLDAAGAAVTMEVLDAGGHVLGSVTAEAGSSKSLLSTMLTPGEYTVRFSAAADASFVLRGASLTDPLGPVKSPTVLKPAYTSPTTPGAFTYPSGVTTTDPYSWLLVVGAPK